MMSTEVLDLAYKVEYFKRNLVKALTRLAEVEKERDELRKENEKLKNKTVEVNCP